MELVCTEHKKKHKLSDSIKRIFEKSYGLTFSDGNNATVIIKEIPEKTLKDKIKNTLIIYHELSHAFNRSRLIDIRENTTDDIVLDGKCFIDELLAHYDSMYCIKREYNILFDDRIDEIEKMLDFIRNEGFSLYPVCVLISYVLLYINESDIEKVDSQYIDTLIEIIDISSDVEYLITKEKITEDDCKNIISVCANNLSVI